MRGWVHKLTVLASVLAAGVLQGCGGTVLLALNGPEQAALQKAKLEKKPVFVGFIETTKPDDKGGRRRPRTALQYVRQALQTCRSSRCRLRRRRACLGAVRG
jgi:hypothetical protein